MNQLDMFSHQLELPVPLPAPVRGLLAQVTPAAEQVDRAIPVLRRPVEAPPARPGQPAVRYMHPNSMQTWTGRGKPPRWVTEWIESGKSLDELCMPGVDHA